MTARIFCVEDARSIARRRLPRIVFDFIDSAAGMEQGMRRNSDEFSKVELMPRVLVNVDERSLEKTCIVASGLVTAEGPDCQVECFTPGR